MRKRVQWNSTLPTRTQQNLKDICDVNKILEKHHKTGMITHVNSGKPISGDFTGYRDFRTNLHLVKQAKAAFADLPSHVRKRFGNDPANLLEFIEKKENYDEAVKLGLIEPKPEKPQASKNDDKTTQNGPTTSPATSPAT